MRKMSKTDFSNNGKFPLVIICENWGYRNVVCHLLAVSQRIVFNTHICSHKDFAVWDLVTNDERQQRLLDDYFGKDGWEVAEVVEISNNDAIDMLRQKYPQKIDLCRLTRVYESYYGGIKEG